MMKTISKLFWILSFCIGISNIHAQSKDVTLTMGLIMPEPSIEFSQEQVERLNSKIIQIVNSSNEVMIGYTNDLVIYPILSVEQTNVIEGGLQNITATTLELSLIVKQIGTNVIYNSYSRKLKGSGNTRMQSITNAINQIKISEEGYKQFLKVSKANVEKYYSENCKNLIQLSDNLLAKQDYEQSISLLQSIPQASADCYNQAQSKSIEAYKKYQSILCTKNLTKAKAAIAANNFSEAIGSLEAIDPASTCYAEVKKLIDQISQKVEKKNQQELDLEKLRINAVKEIAKAYYSNKIRLIKYSTLVR